MYSGETNSKSLIIESPHGKWVYTLEDDRLVHIPGELGTTIIEIHDHQVRFLESPCPNKTCTAAHAIGSNGEWNACLPNHVIARVSAKKKNDEFDAVGY